jgi:PAS domain S-box-containing protein
MRGLSLRAKINIAIFLAFVAAAMAFGTILTISLAERQAASHNRTRALLAVLAAHRLEALAPLLTGGADISAARSILERLLRVDGVTEGTLFDARGEVLATAGAGPVSPLRSGPEQPLPTGRVFTVSAEDKNMTASLVEPIVVGGKSLGFLRLRYSLADLHALNQRIWLVFGLALGSAYLFLATLLNIMLHRFVLRPVDALRQALESLQAGNMGQALPVASNDALGRMTAAFNDMSARLRDTCQSLGESRAEVEENRRLLTRRVEERTAELAKANQLLTEEIEARREAEARQERALALHKAILESTAEAVVCVSSGPGREVLAYNNRFLELWGLPENWADIPDRQPRLRLVLEKLKNTEEAEAALSELLLDGQRMDVASLELRDGRFFERRSGPILQGSVFIGRVFSYVDITERRHAEESLRQALAQRDAVLGNTQIGLATTRDGVCSEINARGAEILGYAREELLHTPIAVLFADHEAYEVVARNYDDRLVANGFVSDEREVRRRDGSLVWIRIHGKVVDPGQWPQDEVWAFDDITDEKRRQAQLEQARATAEQASKAKGFFLAVMSHEIRTPLNAVMGLTDVLLAGEATPDQRQLLGTIKESANHLQGVINDVLDFSKIEAGKLVLERVNFDIRELVSGVARVLEHQISLKNLAFSVAVDDAVPPAFRGDPGRLRQVLLNLLGNAVKFTDAGAISLVVEQAPDLDGEDGRLGLRLRITDTGIGMNAKRLSELFQRFHQGPDSITRRFGGTGLGLVISKQIVERMGGSIEAASEEGKGSTFTFTVRLLPGRAPAADAAGTASGSGGGGRPRLRILIVEDNALNAAVIRLHLERMGHELTVAVSAREAYVHLGRESYDTVLMDIEMPEIDGITATKTIRAGGEPGAPVRDPNVPIIAVTAHAVEEVRQQCLDAGMNGFVTKPVNYNILQQALDPENQDQDAPPPTPVTPSPAMSLFDPQAAREAMGISWEQYQALQQVSAVEGERRLVEAGQAIADADFERAAIAVHTFKGAAATLGAYSCRHLAVLLEGAVRRSDVAESQVLHRQLASLWEQVRRALAAWRGPKAD